MLREVLAHLQDCAVYLVAACRDATIAEPLAFLLNTGADAIKHLSTCLRH
jgi:hypothetical protein